MHQLFCSYHSASAATTVSSAVLWHRIRAISDSPNFGRSELAGPLLMKIVTGRSKKRQVATLCILVSSIAPLNSPLSDCTPPSQTFGNPLPSLRTPLQAEAPFIKAIRYLVRLLKLGTEKQKVAVLWAIGEVMRRELTKSTSRRFGGQPCCSPHIMMIAEAGAVKPLVALMRSGTSDVQYEAMFALSALAEVSDLIAVDIFAEASGYDPRGGARDPMGSLFFTELIMSSDEEVASLAKVLVQRVRRALVDWLEGRTT